MKGKRYLLKRVTALVLTLGIAASMFGTAEAARGDEQLANTAKSIAASANTEVVRTVWWKAKTTQKIKVTVVETGQKVKIKAKKNVTVIQRDYHAKAGISQVQLADGTTCYIPNKYLTFTKAICTAKYGDYTQATKLAYVNGQPIASSTQYLIWISLDKQRVNVFQGSRGNWQLIRECLCSTGKADAPTLDQSFKSRYVIQWKEPKVYNLKLYNAFYGSGVHQWTGGGQKKYIGKQPKSHSCVRLSKKDAKWFYNTIPVKSRVWVW